MHESHFSRVLLKLDAIAEAKGAAAKKQLIQNHLGQDELFAKVCLYALDPGKRFYQTHVTKPHADGYESADGEFEAVFAVLDDLTSRTVTGGDAAAALNDAVRWDSDAETVVNRILKKDLRIGAGADSFNKAVKNFVPVFKVMLAHKFEERHINQWPVAVEPKLDGVRCIAVGTAVDGFIFYTRTGKEMPAVAHLSEELVRICQAKDLDQMVFDGELTSGENFNSAVSSVRRKSKKADDAVFTVFDAINLHTWKSSDEIRIEQRVRRQELIEILGDATGPVKAIDQYLANNVTEIKTMFSNVFDAGGEGVIVKPLNSHYHKKRNRAWLKIKGEETVDCPITGFEVGTGKYADTLGALIVDYNGVEVRVSGMSDANRKAFWNNQEQFMGVMIEVEYHEVTPDGSLRHPRYKRLREDKPVADGVGV